MYSGRSDNHHPVTAHNGELKYGLIIFIKLQRWCGHTIKLAKHCWLWRGILIWPPEYSSDLDILMATAVLVFCFTPAQGVHCWPFFLLIFIVWWQPICQICKQLEARIACEFLPALETPGSSRDRQKARLRRSWVRPQECVVQWTQSLVSETRDMDTGGKILQLYIALQISNIYPKINTKNIYQANIILSTERECGGLFARVGVRVILLILTAITCRRPRLPAPARPATSPAGSGRKWAPGSN